MTTITDYYEFAKLAAASYVTLASGRTGVKIAEAAERVIERKRV